MKVTVKVEGLRELRAALQQLSQATQKNVLLRVLKRRAEPVAERARQLVPVRVGTLRQSIMVTTRARGAKPAQVAFAAAMRAGATREEAGAAARAANRNNPAAGMAEVFVASTNRRYSHMVEFGTENMAAQPYLRPAWDALKQQVLDGIAADIKAEIDKAVARVARKRAGRR